jgi:DNA-binding transcriptional MerR regulator
MAVAHRELPGIPDKSYFRIGEVAKLTGIEAYVLRYWETEFKELAPPKSKSDQRMYRRRDVEMVRTIQKLLYEERYTIEGARQRLAEMARDSRGEARGAPPDTAKVLRRVRAELVELRSLLARG